MKITVTEKNVRHVCGLLKKTFSCGLTENLHYPTTVRKLQNRKSVGLRSNWLVDGITESNKNVFVKPRFETDNMFGRCFVRVSNQHDEDYDENSYRAFLIEPGDVLHFKNDKVVVRLKHPTKDKQKAIQTISKFQRTAPQEYN